jgi:hypothetical protein
VDDYRGTGSHERLHPPLALPCGPVLINVGMS